MVHVHFRFLAGGLRLTSVLLVCATLLLLGGCTKMSQLLVLNSTALEVSVVLSSSEEVEGEKGPWSAGEWQIQEGKWEETLYWSRRPPDWIKAVVTVNGGTIERQWQFDEYPGAMQETSAPFDFYLVEVQADGLVLREPTARERLDYNPAAYILMFLCPATIVIGVAIAMRYSRKAEQRRLN